jgi:hypothetical protein
MTMRARFALILAVLVTAALINVVPAPGQEAASFTEAWTKGSLILSLRYRYENVEDEAIDKEAHASTLRTVMGWKTQAWKGLGALLSAEVVTSIGNDTYNNAGFGNSRNNVRDRPVVADPVGGDVGELYLWYDHAGSKSFAQLGRAEVNIDDQRFIGAVGWRQHHQTFNTFKLTNRSLERVSFLYSYLDRVYRINRDKWDTSSHLLNVRFNLGDFGKLTPYAYLLDFDNQPQYGLSSTSYGLELVGSHQFSDTAAIHFEVEYAKQDDYGSNPGRLDADYLFLMAQGVFKPLSVKLGYEVLSGNETDGQFKTPLATLHKFNGWADRFLQTPSSGLEDLYLAVNGKVGPVRWLLVYHDFNAESVGNHYGDEFDFQFLYAAPWKQEFGLKGAFYSADKHSTDVSKIWFFTSYKI